MNQGLRATVVSFYRLPADAPPREVRRLALRGFGLGLVIFVLGLLWFFAVRSYLRDAGYDGDPSRSSRLEKLVCGTPLAIGYALSMQSLYRLVTGNAPGKESTTLLASIGRILFGLVATFALIALVVLVAFSL